MSTRSQPGSAKLPTIGIDVGGTFTDFVAIMPDGRFLFHKQPSTPDDPSEAVEDGLAALASRDPALAGAPVRIVHGTTIALNAVLQRKVARVALLVSPGNRDVIEIARIKLSSFFNFRLRKEESIVPRNLVFEVGARMAADGRVTSRPGDAELDDVCRRIGESGAESVAIMLLNAYVDPSFEESLGVAVAERLPHLPVTRSADIWPEVREYERAVVACLNAEVHPLMERYLDRLGGRVTRATGEAAVIQLTSSTGGTLSITSARRRAVDTMLSGPASGATAAAKICAAAEIPAAISFDMGGTSADVAVIRDGDIEFTTRARVGELPLMMPVVGVSSIGAGGGSIVSVDAYGIIKVGPESAGANPGPVAYGLGGTRPTVTDCYLVLGLIDPDAFLGGAMKLDVEASRSALAAIAAGLRLPSAEHAAEAALRIATVRMATELFKQLAGKGYEPGRHVLLPFGGAGPTHAAMLATEAGLAGIAVPPAAATFCALGAAIADVRREFVRGLGHARVTMLGPRLWENWEALAAEATTWLAAEGVTLVGQRLTYALDMRYAGQSFSLTTTIPETATAARSLPDVLEAFHQAHESLYGFREPDAAVEAVTQRLGIIGEVPKTDLPQLPPGVPRPRPHRQRPVFHDGAWIEAAVHRREDFGAGSEAAGPAVVEQDDTCLWVPPGWRLAATRHGILTVEREAHDVA